MRNGQLNFHTIRPIRGSANNGFEELCCQLAHAEPMPDSSRFVRNGTPDGGVEGYWIYPDGSEVAWQAKYFFEVGNSQWGQLDESVETALRTHPKLVRYIICLPIDLPDARKKGKLSLRDRWNNRVDQWTRQAAQEGMSVTFDLWGEHELITRLSCEAHSGRRWFWFNATELSREWFDRHLDEVIAGAGPRYDREFSVELPIALKFDALGYTPRFRKQFATQRKSWQEASRSLANCLTKVETEGAALTDTLRVADEALAQAFEQFGYNFPTRNGYKEIETRMSEAKTAAGRLLSLLREYPTAESSEAYGGVRYRRHPYESEIATIDGYRSAIRDVEGFLAESSGELASNPAMLLAGQAGSGKTHLLCDVAKDRIAAGLPTLVLLGQQFGRGDIWRQVLEPLGLNCRRDELLGALEAYAEAADSRALIFIDAINEAAEVAWKDALPVFLETLRHFPRIGVTISCRTTYESYLVRPDLIPNVLSRVVHHGFAPRLHQAIASFCTHYGLETLNTPPLDPEFANPLFLKIFCQGLQSRGLRRPPKGHNGLQRIFEFLIDAVDEKLSQPGVLDYFKEDRIVHVAVDAITDAMVELKQPSVPRSQAKRILESIHPGSGVGNSRSLLAHLIAEGILAEDLRYSREGTAPEHVIRFGYERFTDFQIARRLLDLHVDSDAPATAFGEGGIIRVIFDDSSDSYRLRGVLTALIVLVPERFGREFAELYPQITEQYDFRGAFLEALPWREGRHLTEDALRFVRRLLNQGDHGSAYSSPSDSVLEKVLQLLGLPGHPLNARWLHSKLIASAMPERDYYWSSYVHRSWNGHDSDSPSVLERLIDWAWFGDPDEQSPFEAIDDEVITLGAIVLIWCFTTSNRFIRDKATKALVCLMLSRPKLIPDLLEMFKVVDDLYLSERLYAAVLGVCCRLKKVSDVSPIASAAYAHVFAGDQPPAHLLLRDYARGIVEYAASIGCKFDFNLDCIRPPYRSDPPPSSGLRWDNLDERYSSQVYSELTLSLMPSMGDFARYVMHSDSSGLHTWISTPNPFAEVMSLEAEKVELPKHLSKLLWELKRPSAIRIVIPDATMPDEDVKSESEELESDEATIESSDSDTKEVEAIANRLLEALSQSDRELLEKYAIWESRHSEAASKARELIRQQHRDGDFPCCWILERVMTLGWTPDLFAEFDRQISRNDGRAAKKPERIGKKYQWIAYHELAARVTDQYPYQHDYGSESVKYEGPWQRTFRDIDPTFLGMQPRPKGSCAAWWSPIPSPFPSEAGLNDREWLMDPGSIPDTSSLVIVSHPDSSARWVTLHHQFCEFKEVSQSAVGSAGSRRVSYSLGTYIVRQKDVAKITQELARTEWTGDEVSCPDLVDQFLGEFGWAPSFQNLRKDAQPDLAETAGYDSTQRKTFEASGVTTAHTTMQYTSGSGFDCSLPDSSESYRGYTPSVWLASRMGLSWAKSRFRFGEQDQELIAFDPSHEQGGPGAFLIDEARLLKFLGENKLSILWLIIGEKIVVRSTDGLVTVRSEPRISVFRHVYKLHKGSVTLASRTLGLLGCTAEGY